LTGYKRLLDWFGPLNEGSLLDRMVEILLAPWFYPLFTAKEGEGALKSQGMFLVRLNFGEHYPISPAPFTISFFAGNIPSHSRILRIPPKTTEKFQVYITLPNNKNSLSYTAATLPELIKVLSNNIPQYFKTAMTVLPTMYVEDDGF